MDLVLRSYETEEGSDGRDLFPQDAGPGSLLSTAATTENHPPGQTVGSRPLVPSVFFCRFELVDHYRTVRYAREVIGIVSFDAPPVDELAVNDRLKEWAGEAVDVVTIHPNPKPSDTVEITDGALRGLRAVVERDINDQQRVALLLTTLAYHARIVVNRDQIEPAS